MRQTTRKKYYGRTDVAQNIRSVIGELNQVVNLIDQPLKNPVAEKLFRVATSLGQAANACAIYKFGSKRLKAKIDRLIKEAGTLLTEVQDTPVFMEEKIKAKSERARQKKGGKHGRNDKRHARTDTGSRTKGRKTSTGGAGR
ncbi:MAG: hypothetical protein PHU23_04985 [Dehalococcoidales bacterium]|nr:hypothetical protein [Dehalococcoidales bacterium]